MKFSDKHSQFLDALNSELEEQSAVTREFPDELHDAGEWVFEYRNGDLRQIGYFPLRAVNDIIPVWTHEDGHVGVEAIAVAEWHESFFDFANFASVAWFK